MYVRLFKDQKLFAKLAVGLSLPANSESMRAFTAKSLNPEVINYEDGMAMLYLKLRLEDEHLYSSIKQVLVDEAQDYYPLQYKVLGEIFRGVQYTILGDIGQTIEKNEDESFYEEVMEALKPKKAIKLTLNKSYRSSYEISLFTQRLRENSKQIIAYERHEEMPLIAGHENEGQLLSWIEDKAKEYQEAGYETIAIICKSQKQVNHVYSKLASKLELFRLDTASETFHKGILIMPIYMAKGLEYDAVMVYEANQENYYEEEDKQLLYIASTRALHRLSLGYTGTVTHFLTKD